MSHSYTPKLSEVHRTELNRIRDSLLHTTLSNQEIHDIISTAIYQLEVDPIDRESDESILEKMVNLFISVKPAWEPLKSAVVSICAILLFLGVGDRQTITILSLSTGFLDLIKKYFEKGKLTDEIIYKLISTTITAFTKKEIGAIFGYAPWSKGIKARPQVSKKDKKDNSKKSKGKNSKGKK